MSIIEYSFDIDSIIGLKLIKEEENICFSYVESKPIRYFFGLINSGKYTEAGFLDFPNWWSDDIISPQHLIDNGYLIKLNKVYNKSYVKIQLKSGYEFKYIFQTENEAKEWINNLKIKTNKNFETI